MPGFSGIVAAFLLPLLPFAVQAQQDSSSAPVAPEDRSSYLGRRVMHPESLSGIWETSNGHGGAIGIHLQLDTVMPSHGDKQSWLPQSWQDLEVGVYERKGAEVQFGEQGYFSDSPGDGSVTFDQGRLQLHFVSKWADSPPVDLDLVQQTDGCWDGRLHRGDFDSRVTLCRPSASQSNKASLLVGTWAENSILGQGCMHIVEQAPGEFTGWSDDIQLPGAVVSCTDNVSKPVAVFERFGERIKVHFEEDGLVSFELNAYAMMCCSHTFVGRVAESGNLIRAHWPSGANQVPHEATWKKMPGDSCVASDLKQAMETGIR